MTDTLTEEVRQKLAELRLQYEKSMSELENSETHIVSRQRSKSKIGIRIWSLDCMSYSNNLMMSLKPLPKQDRVLLYDHHKPVPKIQLKQPKVHQLAPDSSDRLTQTILRISKRCSLSDYLVMNSVQKRADQFKIKLKLQAFNRSDFKFDTSESNSLHFYGRAITDLPATTVCCTPTKSMVDLSTCSLKEILTSRTALKSDSHENNLLFGVGVTLQESQNKREQQVQVMDNLQQPQQILRDFSGKKQALQMNCDPLIQESPPKNKLIQVTSFTPQSLNLLSQQITMDKQSRLGIMMSTLKKEVKQQMSNLTTKLKLIKFSEIARDIGQRRPNRLGLLCAQDSLDSEIEQKSVCVQAIKIIKFQLLEKDVDHYSNTLQFSFKMSTEQRIPVSKQCQTRESLRMNQLSGDSSNPNTLKLYSTTCPSEQSLPENPKVQPKMSIQYEANLAKNRKKIEEIKQLIHSSKKSNPLVLATYNKTSSTAPKPQQVVQKIVRNESVHSNGRGSRPMVAEKGPTQRSVSNEKQVTYMQMSKNYKSPLNRFKKIKYLGKGHVSDVYSVIDTMTGMIAALKTIQKSVITSKGLGKLIKTEIAIQSYINHPNILKCYGVINDDKQIALILELGDTTLQNFKKEKKLQEKQIIDIIYQVLRGVGHLHSKGIIHRDIKPENILLQGSVIKLADLGICVQTSEATQYCGTPGFMAPEILQNQKYDQKVDCYSIGVLLHEMLFNKLPKSGVKINGDTQLLTLMNKLLETNPQQRISCRMALEYDLFKICERRLTKQNEMIKNTIIWDY